MTNAREKLLVICGPTATGKTELGLKLARKFDGEIVSADSRQVYKGLDIGTGKDIPSGSRFVETDAGYKNASIGYYLIDGVRMWGYDLAAPEDEFSVAEYCEFASCIVSEIASRGKLPIIVGGTGFYIKALVEGIETLGVPKNNNLRMVLEDNSPNQLYEKLALLDATKAASLNASDSKNPRRLIRAIEVADMTVRTGVLVRGKFPSYDLLMVGLFADKSLLQKRVKDRVEQRMNTGFIDEVKNLVSNGVSWDDQSMQSFGYKQSKALLEGKVSQKLFVSKWSGLEMGYIKRQMTWFRKDKRIMWYDAAGKDLAESVEKLVGKWYKADESKHKVDK